MIDIIIGKHEAVILSFTDNLSSFVANKMNNWHYYSFKIFRHFWLAKTSNCRQIYFTICELMISIVQQHCQIMKRLTETTWGFGWVVLVATDKELHTTNRLYKAPHHCQGTFTFPCNDWPGITTVIPWVVTATPEVTGTAATDTPGGSIPGNKTLSFAPRLNKALIVGSEDTAAFTSAGE